MKKIIVLFLIMIALVACADGKSDHVKVVELTNFSTMKKETERNYTDEYTVDIFNNAVKHAMKVDGIVDVADPMYQFELADETYFLWLFEEDKEGSIMNKSDTHTIYRVTERDTTQLKEILNK